MKKGWRRVLAATVIGAGILCGILQTPFAGKIMEVEAAENIASGVVDDAYGQITWVINSEGHLTVTGTGDVSTGRTERRTPWYEYRNEIVTAEIDVTGMTDASYLFYGCSGLQAINMVGFDTSDVTDMNYMFYGCETLETLDLSGFDSSKVTSMSRMFYKCKSLEKLNLNGFDTRNVEFMVSMFEQCSSLKNLDLSDFDTKNVTLMNSMFADCTALEKLDISGFNTGNVTSMERMFSNCRALKSLDLDEFDTANVTDMKYMFYTCKTLEELDLSSFSTINVYRMNNMFEACTSLKVLDVSGFDTSNVSTMIGMFRNCNLLEKLDLSSFVISNKCNTEVMLYNCWSLSQIETPRGCSKEVELPKTSGYAWYLPDGTSTTVLPQNLGKSFVLTRKPVFAIESFVVDQKKEVKLHDEKGYFSGVLKLQSGSGSSPEFMSSIVKSIQWSSSDASIVDDSTINCDGVSSYDGLSSELLIGFKPQKAGKVIITGTLNGVTVKCEVTVKGYEIAEFTMDDITALYVKEERNLTGIIKLKEKHPNGEKILSEEISKITWKSSNQEIVSDEDIICNVSDWDGGTTGEFCLTIKAKKCGWFTLTGITNTGNLKVTVDIPVVVSLKYRTDGKFGTEMSPGTESSNARHCYYYSDEFFYGDSRNYNNSLAVMSLGLELASFSNPIYDTRYTEELDGTLRAKNLIDAYNKLGFENAQYYNYNTPLSSDADKVAYSFAKKTISKDGTEDTLIAVVVRGGGYGAEWVSNFHVGNKGNSNGFDTAAEAILPNLKAYVNSTNIEGNVKLWIVGFSRGGAVANILTHNINENMSEVHSTLKQSNIFTYTFATPNGYRKNNNDKMSDSNLWNIVSANDLVPKVPLVLWGFSKYGNTQVLPEYSNAGLRKSFKEYTGIDFDISNANKAELAMTDVLYDITLTTEEWVKTLEPSVMTALRAIYKKSILENTKFGIEVVKAIDEVIKVKTGAFRLIYTLSCVVGEEMYYVATADEDEPSIAHVLKNLAFAHYPEHYLCWLEGGDYMRLKDELYASLTPEDRETVNHTVESLFSSTYKKYHFYCPVDVEVTDSTGTVVASIVNNVVITEKIPCYVEGDEKIVYLPDNKKYDIKLTGNDKGTMDYIVQEFNSMSDIVRTVYYYDIPLEDGIVYTDSVQGDILNEKENYSIINGSKRTTPALDTNNLTADVKLYTIEVINGNSLKTKAVENESVDILALPDNGKKFVKWTSNLGEEIFDDPLNSSTRIRMPAENVRIEAVLRESEPEEVLSDVTEIFTDVYADWYTPYVQYVYDNSLMTGIKGTTKFQPNANITKAQVAQVLYNMEGQPVVKDKKAFTDLKDVYEVEWYANAVAWAYNTGVVTGDLNTKKFSPNANVTREQLALMLYRYAQFKKYSTIQNSDLSGLKNAENVSNWASDGVRWAVGAGLISGVEKNGVKDLAPQGNASRAQVAAILMRFCKAYIEDV